MVGEFQRKLARWQEAGLISPDQATRIESFEREHKSGSFQKKLTKIAVFAILLGVSSIIGANWKVIPDFLKLLMHFILNLGVVVYMLRLDPVTHTKQRDFCLLGLFGLFLTFIALIAQIYQLHGELYQTLIFWIAICTPFIWYFGRSYIIAWPWLLITCGTFYYTLFETIKTDTLAMVGVLSALYIPVALLIASKWEWLADNRPGFKIAFQRLGLVLPAIFATCGVLLFYVSRSDAHFSANIIWGLIAGLTFILFAFRPKKEDATGGLAFHLWIYLLLSYVLYTLPFILPEKFVSGLLSAILFILYWGYMAYLGARTHSVRLMDLGIQLVMLRLFIVFLEVFGSLLVTGYGLILAGILLLILLKNRARLIAFGQKLVRYEF